MDTQGKDGARSATRRETQRKERRLKPDKRDLNFHCRCLTDLDDLVRCSGGSAAKRHCKPRLRVLRCPTTVDSRWTDGERKQERKGVVVGRVVLFSLSRFPIAIVPLPFPFSRTYHHHIQSTHTIDSHAQAASR